MIPQNIYNRAIDFAARAHGDQKVPGKPYSYVVHLSNVAMEILIASQHEPDMDLDLALTCALLHDTLEDTTITYQEIKKNFGPGVAEGVIALTKSGSLAKNEAMIDSLERILRLPREIGMVKLADRITNLQHPPDHWNEEKIKNYKNEAQIILEKLGHSSSYLAQRLYDRIQTYGQR